MTLKQLADENRLSAKDSMYLWKSAHLTVEEVCRKTTSRQRVIARLRRLAKASKGMACSSVFKHAIRRMNEPCDID